jgi:hypothetical protein
MKMEETKTSKKKDPTHELLKLINGFPRLLDNFFQTQGSEDARQAVYHTELHPPAALK